MRKHPLTIIFLFIALLVSTSCDSPLMDLLPTTPTPTRPPIACSDIPVAKLADIFANGGSIDEAIPWIEAVSGTTPEVDEFYESKNRDLRWSDGNNKYTAYYDENGLLYQVTLDLEYAHTPTIEEVLTCFGSPERYRALLEVSDRKIVGVDLLYPAIGIIFSGYRSDRRTIPSLVEEWMPMPFIYYVAPGTTEHMIRNIFHNRISTDKDYQKFFAFYRSWPGSLDAMEIEDPFVKQ